MKYRVWGNNTEYLLSVVIEARSKSEAKEKYLKARWERGLVEANDSELKIRSEKYENR